MSLAKEMLFLIKWLRETSCIFWLAKLGVIWGGGKGLGGFFLVCLFFFSLTCAGTCHSTGNLLCLLKMCSIHCISHSFCNWIGHMLMWYPDKQEVSKQAH